MLAVQTAEEELAGRKWDVGFPEAVAQYIPLAPQKRMNFSFQVCGFMWC